MTFLTAFATSDLIEDQISDDLKKSNFFALMFDETTDCSIVEQLVIHTSFNDPDGAVEIKFLKMLDALKPAECDEDNSSNDHIVSLNASNIARRVKDYVASKHLMFSKFVGIGTDGASVMTGKHNGAVKQIVDFQLDAQAESAPSKCEAVRVHCAAHN